MPNEKQIIYTNSSGTLDTSLLPSGGATLTGTETLTNKTISGASNTITNIGQSSITNGFVDLTSSQTIAGAKTFSTPIAIASGGTGSATQNFVDLTNAQSVAGIKTFTSSLFVTGTTATRSLVVSADAGYERRYVLRTGLLDRWDIVGTSTAEGGSDAGSNFVVRSYNDAGTLLHTPLSIVRSTGSVSLGRSIRLPITSTTIDLTLTDAHHTILVDATSGNRVITLPAVASANGVIYNIKKIDSSVNTVTIQADGAELIDGANTNVISSQYASKTIQSTASAWYVI